MTLDPQEEYDLYDIRDLERDPDDEAKDPHEAEEHSERTDTPKVDRRGWLARLLRQD